MCRRQIHVTALALLSFFAVASSRACAADPVDLSGKWHGQWVSCTSGHRGLLNATFCKVNETCYSVRFTGTFAGVIPFGFTAPLQVTGQQDGKIVLSGSHRLPLFGVFQFTAVATNCEFTADYCSQDDQGRFLLCR